MTEPGSLAYSSNWMIINAKRRLYYTSGKERLLMTFTFTNEGDWTHSSSIPKTEAKIHGNLLSKNDVHWVAIYNAKTIENCPNVHQ